MPDREELPGRWRSFLLLTATAGSVTGARGLLAFVLVPLSYATSVFSAAFVKTVVDNSLSGQTSAALVGAIGLALTVNATLAFAEAELRLRTGIYFGVANAIDERLVRSACGIQTIDVFEDPMYLDRFELARQSRGQVGQLASSLASYLGVLLQATLALGLLIAASPWLAAVALAGVPTLVLRGVSQSVTYRTTSTLAGAARKRAVLVASAATEEGGRDLRGYCATQVVTDEFEQLSDVIEREMARVQLHSWFIRLPGLLLSASSVFVAVAVLLRFNRNLSPGDVVMVFLVASDATGRVLELSGATTWLSGLFHVSRNFAWLDGLADRRRASRDRIPTGSVEHDQTAPDAAVVSAQGLSFRYRVDLPDVLKDIDLNLSPGSVTAIVGPNGAGKSTLANLLLGLYLADGELNVAGSRLEPSNLEVWRQRTSAAFQDSARFEVLLREAVGLGDWSGNVSDDRILEALKRVGADSLLERAPSGLDTQLGASWSGGVDLSGGEWQLVALGRALMRESPALVVLDEPTSALDADREYALFQAISSMVNETRLKAAIVLISHRFSTVALADRIVVLDSGQIIECGTHDDLLAVNGSYAQMFKLQAANYR